MSAPPAPRWPAAGAAAALGALQTLCYVHTAAWPLQILCLAGLAWGVLRATPRRAALLGGAFGSAWLACGVWWLFISLHRYGGLPAGLAAAAVGLLALALAGYLALAMAAVARARSGAAVADALLFALAWCAAELARALLFTGFPWLATGYAQVDGPLAALAPWIGVYGMGAVAAAIAALLAGVAGRWRTPATAWRPAALALALLAVPGLIGTQEFSRASGSLQVSLLQTNVAQDEKFAAEHMAATLDWVAAELTGAAGDLVVAPETAVPLLPAQLAEFAPDYWPQLRRHFGAAHGPAALVGVPLGDYERGYTNSVAGLSAATALASGDPYRYDKAHLVPFGEFIPSGFRWFTDLMNIPLGDFTRGRLDAPSFAVRGERVAPNVCYEDLFGEELALRLAVAETAPTVLANVSNIGWFGDTIAVEQHLQISRLRTLELQRPMLRATNTGATAIIDHRGRVTAQLAPFSRGVLRGTVQGRTGRTPYAAWVATTGLWPWLALAWLALLLAARRAQAGR